MRDPYYGYGYDNGALAVGHAADDGIVPFEDYGLRLSYAARYWTRGRALWAASFCRPRFAGCPDATVRQNRPAASGPIKVLL